jgi:hypothetical protein
MKHKVSELEGALLNDAVGLAEGATPRRVLSKMALDGSGQCEWRMKHNAYAHSWEYGGPIIEREWIEVGPSDREGQWFACLPKSPREFNVGAWGATPLIAAMRAYVASKFGDEVDL